MSGGENADAAVQTMDDLSEIFGSVIGDALKLCISKTKEMTGLPDPILFAALVSGGLIGLLTFMAEKSIEGHMDDPHGHLTRLFLNAGACWDDMRSGQSDGKVTLQ